MDTKFKSDVYIKAHPQNKGLVWWITICITRAPTPNIRGWSIQWIIHKIVQIQTRYKDILTIEDNVSKSEQDVYEISLYGKRWTNKGRDAWRVINITEGRCVGGVRICAFVKWNLSGTCCSWMMEQNVVCKWSRIICKNVYDHLCIKYIRVIWTSKIFFKVYIIVPITWMQDQ